MSKRRAIGGAAWTIGGYAAIQVFRFVFNIALAHFAAPKVFGVMALVNLIIQGLHMFSDLGIRQCVIQHSRGNDPSFLRTAWTLKVLRGGLLWLGAAAMAWPMAAFYEEPALLWLIPLAGLAAFITGFSSTSLLTYSREVLPGPLVRREVGVYVASFSLVLVALHLIRQEWPENETRQLELAVIALGGVLAALGEVVLSFTLPSLVAHRFAWDAGTRKDLLRFGGWVFVSSGCTFFASQADRLVVGKLSLELLGVYHIAVVFATLPLGVLIALGSSLVFPLMTEATRKGESLTVAFRRAHHTLGVAAGLLLTTTACLGPVFLWLLYDNRYAEAAGFVQLLVIVAWVTALLIPGEMALLALGKTQGLAVAQGARLLSLPVFLFVGYSVGGVPGLILGMASGELVRYVVVACYLHGAGLRSYREDAVLTALAALLFGGYLLADTLASEGEKITVAVVAAAIQTALWLGVTAIWVVPARLFQRVRPFTLQSRTTADAVRP